MGQHQSLEGRVICSRLSQTEDYTEMHSPSPFRIPHTVGARAVRRGRRFPAAPTTSLNHRLEAFVLAVRAAVP